MNTNITFALEMIKGQAPNPGHLIFFAQFSAPNARNPRYLVRHTKKLYQFLFSRKDFEQELLIQTLTFENKQTNKGKQ